MKWLIKITLPNHDGSIQYECYSSAGRNFDKAKQTIIELFRSTWPYPDAKLVGLWFLFDNESAINVDDFDMKFACIVDNYISWLSSTLFRFLIPLSFVGRTIMSITFEGLRSTVSTFWVNFIIHA